MSIKYINNNDKVIDNSYLAELDNVIHPVGIVMPWIKHIVPEEVCKGMVDMLDSTGWFIKNIDKSPQEYIDSHRVLDICCRSGNFLRAFYERFNVYLSYKIKNQDKRDYFIWRYLLFGFAGQIREELSKGLTADQENKVADAAIKELRKELYSGFCFYEEDFHGNIYDIQFRPYLDGNNLVWTGKDCPGYTTTFENRAFGKELNEMKFNAVIGNPPYNNDMYIPFVEMGHQLATDCSLFITPAKWQAKGGKDNEAFRQNIVPYMKDIIYFIETKEVFDIGEPDGISVYSIDKDKHINKRIRLRCDANSVFDTEPEEIDCSKGVRMLSSKIASIVDKCSVDGTIENKLSFTRQVYCNESEKGHPIKSNEYNIGLYQGADSVDGCAKLSGWLSKDELKTTKNLERYKCIQSIKTVRGSSRAFGTDGKTIGGNLITILEPYQVPKGTFQELMTFETKLGAESFKSFIMSKLCSFLEFIGVCGHTENTEFYRFVPAPVAFDHIFTDEELYKKYNLTDEEINIIESVIKERK